MTSHCSLFFTVSGVNAFAKVSTAVDIVDERLADEAPLPPAVAASWTVRPFKPKPLASLLQ